jgi:2-polyprenyl-3-methyl-5-hydroxy-6-metoxy-1,4-benzoquinol methylase
MWWTRGVQDEPRRVDVDADAYDAQWQRLAASGADVHGEASLVERLLDELGARPAHGTPRVLDAGCGTGRVAIELARRGIATVGVDVDEELLHAARAKGPALAWVRADLATMPRHVAAGPFDAIVLAGNVMIFVAPATEGAVLRNLAARLAPDGIIVAGYQLVPGRVDPERYDELAADAGLVPVARWSTWDREPFRPGSTYQVSVHRARSDG